MSIQNIMNTCFAICITLLIYQNTQLKDKLDTADFFAQLDVNKTSDRLDAIDERMDKIDEVLTDFRRVINQNHEGKNLLIDEVQRLDKNIVILEDNQKLLRETVKNIEDYIIENFSGKPR